MSPIPIVDALELAVARMQQRIATAYERVACPCCGAAAGERCHQAGQHPNPRELKHSHKERLRADGISLR